MLEKQIPISTHAELTLKARESLKNNWTTGVVITLVYMVIAGAISFIPFGSLLVTGPLSVGIAIYALKTTRDQPTEVNDLFIDSSQLGTAIGAYLLMFLLIFIGMILLIIPGIIVALGLSQTFFLLAENKDMGAMQAIEESWNMMKGHKGDYFLFSLRFIPWAFLAILTLGIGFLWLYPYMSVSFANYHRELVGDHGDTAFDPSDHLIEY